MDKIELRRKWAEALRSGKYVLARGCLKSLDGGYCCLGVAAEVAGARFELVPNLGYKLEGEWRLLEWLPLAVVEAYGLRGRVGEISESLPVGEDEYDSLTELNDNGWEFSQIADLIENQPEIVFKD